MAPRYPDGRRTFDGIGRQDGKLRPDYGPRYADLKCDMCGATWVGQIDDPCTWCEDRKLQVLKEQRELDRKAGRPIRLVIDEYETDDEWPDPLPLADSYMSPAFPVAALPAWMADHVEQVAREFQFTADLPAMLGIAALSIACARRAVVIVQGTWREQLCIYSATAAAPGEGKSPVVRQMLGCLDRYEAALIERTEPDRDEARTRRSILEKEYGKAVSAGDAAQALAIADDLRGIPEPVTPRLMADDVTPEKLAEMIAEQGGRMALVSTEGGVFGLMTGRYSEKTNLDVYLKSWSGDALRIDRIGRKSAGVVLDPVLTVGLTVQPSVIQSLADTPELAGRGLTARFMYAFPPSNVGRRKMGQEPAIDPLVAERYEQRVIDLIDRMEGGSHDHVVTLDADARAVYFDWRQDMEDRCGPSGDLRDMVEWITKLGSTVARLAAMLALADNQRTVDGATMERAISVGRYWEAQGRIAHAMWRGDVTVTRAGRVLDWLADTKPKTFTMRDVYAVGVRTLTPEDAADVCRYLVEKLWITQVDEQPLVAGRRGVPSPTFQPHPDLSSFRNNHARMHIMRVETQNLSTSSSVGGGMEGGGHAHDAHARMTPVMSDPPSSVDNSPQHDGWNDPQ